MTIKLNKNTEYELSVKFTVTDDEGDEVDEVLEKCETCWHTHPAPIHVKFDKGETTSIARKLFMDIHDIVGDDYGELIVIFDSQETFIQYQAMKFAMARAEIECPPLHEDVLPRHTFNWYGKIQHIGQIIFRNSAYDFWATAEKVKCPQCGKKTRILYSKGFRHGISKDWVARL